MLVLAEYKLYRAYIESTDNVLRYLGYRVVDKNLGELGLVKNIDRRSQVLLEIEGDDSAERIVPFAKGLIEKIDHKDRIIMMNLPEGIFE
jgi:ribosomal 30S subunit maturation factor RimM